ncbi:MAG: PD-(D/E)XK nuclease family protein [Candidatus Woykebacteria bacterium]
MAFDYNPNTIWISHSSLGDFEKCPRLYFLRNLYRDKTYGNNFRIQVANPYLSLGEVVHEAIDKFVERHTIAEKNKDKIMYELSRGWQLKPGKIGGFKTPSQEKEFKDRAVVMLERFFANKDSVLSEPMRSVQFPKKKLFPGKDIVLVGNFDWLEDYKDGLHILDFKTGQHEEAEDSLQLPIYSILAKETFGKEALKTSYWYLDKEDAPKEVSSKDLDKSLSKVEEKALAVENAIVKDSFPHSRENCLFCREYEQVLEGKAEKVATDFKRKREVFFV